MRAKNLGAKAVHAVPHVEHTTRGVTPAVHRKCGKKIEQYERHIDRRKLGGKVELALPHGGVPMSERDV